MMKRLYIILFIAFAFTNYVSAQTNNAPKLLLDRTTQLNKSIEILTDTVIKGIGVRYDERRNAITFTMRVIKTPDPFTETLGRFYKEYYKKAQIKQLIDKWVKNDQLFLNVLKQTKPIISYQIYGKTTTSFEISSSELIQAKQRMDNGFIYLETYDDFLSDIYFGSMPKEEFVTVLWEQISPLADKVPFQSTNHIVISKITMTNDNILYFEYLQDDKRGKEEELMNERISQFLLFKDFSRGFIKALSTNDVSIRYKFINKSNGSIFSDTTFSGDEILQIDDGLIKK